MTQRDPEWYATKIGKVSASMFKAAMASPSTKTYQSYKDDLVDARIGLINMQNYDEKPWFRHGLEMEPRALEAYAFYISGRYPDATVVSLPPFIPHPNLRAGCSPDALIVHNDRVVGGAEVKCRKEAEQHWKIIQSGIESVYLPQVQGAMWVTGLPWWHYVSYCEDNRFAPEHRLHVITIARDERYIAKLEKAVRLLDEQVQSEAEAILSNL
jgi:hypothetical protein